LGGEYKLTYSPPIFLQLRALPLKPTKALPFETVKGFALKTHKGSAF